jgi:nucleoside-diphosphate-sugar epimerase
MRTLVTGATGFLGNYVIQELLRKKIQVIATSTDQRKAEIQNWFRHVKYIPFDFTEFVEAENYFDFFEEPDVLIHLAWQGLPNYENAFHEEANLPLHEKFLNNIISNGLLSLTVTGTCLEYGKQEGALKEDFITLPTTAYGRAKDKLRKYLQSLRQLNSFSFKWVRLFYVYGKGQNPNSLLSQLNRALENDESSFRMSGGQQIRDFLSVEDAAENIVTISLQDRVTGIINCCSGKPVTVERFVRNYLQQSGKNINLDLGYYPYLGYEPMQFWGDTTKLKTIIRRK